MNKEDKPVIIVSDTDYAKICNELEKAAPDERFGTLLDCIKVVVDAKTEKRLWKAKSTVIHKKLPIPPKTDYTDVRELTIDEAVSWYDDWVKHLNDYICNGEYTVYNNGLFYKKDGEWVIYRFEPEGKM